mgnify:CR=1 FL=1
MDGKDVLLLFPETRKTNKTVLVLKKPKTTESERKDLPAEDGGAYAR